MAPPRAAKRSRIVSTSTVANSDDDYLSDVEKRFSPTEFSSPSSPSSSTYSSRVSSGTHRPMIGAHHRRGGSGAAPKVSNAYSYRNPRMFSRYFSLALGSTVILFILMLVHNGRSSLNGVSIGYHQKPKPPAWEAFSMLQRYQGGVKNLVPRDSNLPEFPPLKGKKKTELEAAAAAAAETNKAPSGAVPASEIFNPYPNYESDEYKNEFGDVARCFLDAEKKIPVPQLHVYRGVPKGMPDNVFGSYEVLGLRNDVCFERFGRLGPYGYGYTRKNGGIGAGLHGEREGVDKIWERDGEVDYRRVNWADAQRRCLEANMHRFKQVEKNQPPTFQSMDAQTPPPPPPPPPAPASDKKPVGRRQLELGTDGKKQEAQEKPKASESHPEPGPVSDNSNPTSPPVTETGATSKQQSATTSEPAKALTAKKTIARSAVIIRTWSDYKYDEEDILYLRSMIAELSLLSAGEFTIHFLVHVKDDNLQIWSDKDTYDRVLRESLPEEFRGMGTLWSQRQMFLIYGGLQETVFRDLPVYGVYRSTYFPVQWFSQEHPEYEFIWHWEMDTRLIGNWYHFFDRVGKFGKDQPRKELWERNHRFYIPAKHGKWSKFQDLVHIQMEHGTRSRNNMYEDLASHNGRMPPSKNKISVAEVPIWGPLRPLDDKLDTTDDPVPPSETDAEDEYTWGVGEEADFITLNPLFDPINTNWILSEDVTGYNTTRGFPPRRTSTITASRLSRRLLKTMHRETAFSRHHSFSEMWPGTVALHHGLKAVYAPHPVYLDRKWDPIEFVDITFNAGRNGATGGTRNSVFSDDYQHNFAGSTWFYNAAFASKIWSRWLGFKVDNEGGEDVEKTGEGRICLPSMLLHPVKDVALELEPVEEEQPPKEA